LIIVGWSEEGWSETRTKFFMQEHVLCNTVNERRYVAGQFDTPSVAELWSAAEVGVASARGEQGLGKGAIHITNVVADAAALQCASENQGSTFQVASQMNCLEFPQINCSPEDGITNYQRDKTQGRFGESIAS